VSCHVSWIAQGHSAPKVLAMEIRSSTVASMSLLQAHICKSRKDRSKSYGGPKENHHRPAIDPLFRTAALAYGSRVVGVVLSGADGDGTAGLQAVKQCGGVAVVQDPEEALFARMPESALEYVEVDYCPPLDEIAALLSRLAGETTRRKGAEQGG
jgi:chemotaxis response regulator CheB